MERIVTNILRFISGRDSAVTEMNVNRIAQGRSHDRALAAFKAEQASISRKRDEGNFSTKRGKLNGTASKA